MCTHVSFYVLSWAISFILQFICVAIVGDKLSLLNISLGYYCCRNYLVVVKLAEELQELLLASQVLPNEVLRSVKVQLQLYVFYYLSVVFQFELVWGAAGSWIWIGNLFYLHEDASIFHTCSIWRLFPCAFGTWFMFLQIRQRI